MTSYWCKFLNARGHVCGGEKMEAADDAAAIAKARVIFATGLIDSFEIWEDHRLAYRQSRKHASVYR